LIAAGVPTGIVEAVVGSARIVDDESHYTTSMY
jgi:hypothetical protein